ncbi:monooxygenase [Streptomyces mobaraensis]|uniref:monooxygenase n=1 Tax=Streptomyces mobaraensis TaxID=35621 RepID=UPI0033D02F22
MDTDVVVVGAGPVGLMVACELALAGVRARVLERRAAPRPHARALSVHPRSVELLDQRGLLERFLPLGRAVPGWHFAGLRTALDFAALDSRHGYALVLAQTCTEALLEQRARELGVEVCRGVEVVGVRQDGEGVEVLARASGGTETVRGRFVVGCDGGRSFVRRAAGIGFPGTEETLSGVLGDVAVVDPPPGALDAARERGVIVVPLEGGLTRFVYVDPERMRVPSREPVTWEEFRGSLVRITGSDCGVAGPRWLSRFGNATRLAERYRAGRVLLAGDAAHIHFPAAGQGLNTGLQDAVNLGWKLAAEVKGWAPPGLLDSYDAERRPVGRSVTQNTEVQTLLAELTLVERYQRPAAALRELLERLLGMAEVNRWLAGQVSALGTCYPPAAAGADPLVGRRMPDVGLTIPGSSARRVCELLVRGRFVLLALAGDPACGEVALEEAVGAGWGSRVTAVTARTRDAHADLDGVVEVLIRPDGHVAWATRTPDAGARAAERIRALTAWAGTPS